MSRPRVLFVTIVPSPYQRDLFCELANARKSRFQFGILKQRHLIRRGRRRSWKPTKEFYSGFWMPVFGTRWHINWALPDRRVV